MTLARSPAPPPRRSMPAHIRDEANHVFEAVREAIGIGESAGVRVQIAHLKLSAHGQLGETFR